MFARKAHCLILHFHQQFHNLPHTSTSTNHYIKTSFISHIIKHITPRILCRSTFAFLVHFHNPSSSKETKVTRFLLKLKIYLKLTHFLQTQKPLLSNFKRFWLETNIIIKLSTYLKKYWTVSLTFKLKIQTQPKLKLKLIIPLQNSLFS